ncbi:hypothetical protein FF2_035871 [Malus domestica]
MPFQRNRQSVVQKIVRIVRLSFRVRSEPGVGIRRGVEREEVMRVVELDGAFVLSQRSLDLVADLGGADASSGAEGWYW